MLGDQRLDQRLGPRRVRARVSEPGGGCFGYVIEQVRTYCAAHGVERDANEIAVALWTFVHGAASLLIDGSYRKVTPGLEVDEMIASATPLLLGMRRPAQFDKMGSCRSPCTR